jgi:hypothetical protein
MLGDYYRLFSIIGRMKNVYSAIIRLFTFSFIILISSISCSRQKETNDLDIKKIKIDVTNIQPFSINEIFSSIELIPLSTSVESVIKRVHKLEYFSGRYYILDDETLSLFIFNGEGKYLFKIHNVGNGPEEYSLIYDFNLNRFTNTIELLNPRGSLLEFTLDGKYLRTLKIPLLSASNFADLNNDTLVFYTGSEKYKLNYYSRSKGEVFKKDFVLPEKVHNIPMITRDFSPLSISNDGSVIFFVGYNSSSYSIVNCNSEYRVIWDFGKHNFNLEDMPEEESLLKKERYLNNCNTVHSFRYYQENNKYIFMDFTYKKVWYSIIYDRNSKNCKLIRKFKEGLFPPFNPVAVGDDILFTANASDIQLFVNKDVLDARNRKIFESIQPEDNPVIIKYHLK